MEKQLIIISKNRSLQNYVDLALKEFENFEIIEARGEDIPFLLNRYLKNNKKIIGCTGSDLLREFKLRTRDTSISVLKKIVWNDEKAIFGKPTLCLLGPENKGLNELPKKLKVCINSKYKQLSKRYLNYLEEKGYTFQKFYVNGETESTFLNGLSDLVIDVVYTGNSIKKNKLQVYDKIFQSDFVIVGLKRIEPRLAVQKMSAYNPPTSSRLGKLRLDFNENAVGCSPKVLDALKKIGQGIISMYPEYDK